MTRVLVVDDNALITRLVAARLHLEGHECVEVNDPAPMLNPEDPRWDCDVLICDVIMPGVDGVRVLDVAKECHPGVYRIALTALDTYESGILEQVYHAADRVLRKPEDIELLAATVGTAGGGDVGGRE